MVLSCHLRPVVLKMCARVVWIGLFLYVAIVVRTTKSSNRELAVLTSVNGDAYRLPTDVFPVQYNIHLEPNLDPLFKEADSQFTGHVTVQVEVQQDTDNITLHASGLNITETSVKRLEGNDVVGDNLLLDSADIKEDKYELINFPLTETIKIGKKYLIDIKYTGKLHDDMHGFYISNFYDINNKPQMLAATQFQATYARRAFPCFDEPSFKAKFKVTIVAPKHMGVLGNMPAELVEELTNGYKKVTFKNTMAMSSYLLAIVISPFASNEDRGEEGEVLFKTWTRTDAIEWTEYSLNVSRAMLRTLENYTGIPYLDSTLESPFTKVDQVALPDFAAGAMENWGLITYRETALLYNDGSADAKKFVAMVIAHELAHMWFGNLVTTHWWDTTWLNEGFARFFQYYVTDKVESSWRMWDQFLVDQHQMVFALDSLATAKALTHRVSSPAEVSASFGSITYNKGAAILRMFSYIIGPVNFRTCLQQYLQKHKYSSVEPADLFTALKSYAKFAHLSDDEFLVLLHSWTEQPGYPMVTVIRDYESRTAVVSQKRFLFDGKSSETYFIPLTWTQQGRTFEIWQPEVYLKPDETSLPLRNMPTKDSWVIFNVQETGYYRVNYDLRNWELIAEHLKSIDTDIGDIHELNRAQLLDDAFNLARAGHLPYNTVFQLADYLKKETEYVPWAAALTAFDHLDRMLINHAKYPVFKRYILRLLDKKYEKFNFEIPEGHKEKLHLNLLATWTCKLEHQLCNVRTARDLVDYVDESKLVPSDLRSMVYCYGIRNTDNYYWDYMWHNYKQSRDDVERGIIVNGLACSKNTSRLEELLRYSISPGEIRQQDGPNVFSAIYINPTGVNVALDFLYENFIAVADYYASMKSINTIVTEMASHITTAAQFRKLENLVETFEDKLGNAGYAAIEIANDNLRWLATYQNKIFSILEEKEMMEHRLPRWVTPQNYTLSLDPIINKRLLHGNVTIRVKALGSIDVIKLHSQDIEATYLSIQDLSNPVKQELYERHSYDTHLQIQNIYLKKRLVLGHQYEIEITFLGHLRNDMFGLYISSYTDSNGNEREILASHFQPTHARKAFPCFDEPGLKATFEVKVKTPPYYRALGNMPPYYTRVWDDFSSEVTYRPTPEMSTYLLALVVSDFAYSEDATGNVVFRTWARPDALPWAQYSLLVSRDILEALEAYTAIPYTDPNLHIALDKMDQVALPDFSAGAMENWGLVTYRETALLYNGGTASARKSVATIIAHELAHMWFGNLVTTHWWDTTWLNEGFAQYFQFFITDKVKPSWRLMDQFLVDHHQGIFASDSLAASQALTADAYTPAQVSARFSGITYSKGGSILRMLSAIVGEEIFKEVLQKYLQTHAYKTTTPEDLFNILAEKAYNINLTTNQMYQLLISWTEQPGFPVITIERNYENGRTVISQKRFLLIEPKRESSVLYYVPLTWVKEGEDFNLRTPQNYIANDEKTTSIQITTVASKWVIFNVQATGFYRVNYDAQNWKLIAEYLVDSSKPLSGIHVLNRAQLLDDAFNLARAGQLPYATAIALSDYLPREVDYVPWASALSAFSFLQRMLINNEKYAHFEKYVLHLISDLYNHYKFQDCEEHLDKLLLNHIITWACALRLEKCIHSATEALENYLDRNILVPVDLKSVVYCHGIRHSSIDSWDRLWEMFKYSVDNFERDLIAAGLACSQHETKLKELLRYSINEEYIRKQDASSVFTAVYSNSKGLEVALEFLDEHFEEVEKYFGSVGAINDIVIGISGQLTTEKQREKLENFVSTHSDRLGSTAAKALETIDENLEWLNKNAEEILNTLVDHQHPSFPTFEHPSPCTRITETTTIAASNSSSTDVEIISPGSEPTTPCAATRVIYTFHALFFILLFSHL